MAMERVPYLVGGGFEHSAEVMRAMLAASTSGAEGIVNAGDFKVRPLAVPGTSVRVAPGNALIRNSYGGGQAQTYACRAGSETEVPIEATGSSGARADLIVARIDDPTYEGGAFDPETFEAAKFEVIRGVNANQSSLAGLGLTYPAIPLARINIPASTGTITSSMITSLRSIALPRKERHLFAHALVGDEERFQLTSTGENGMAWPEPQELSGTGAWRVDVPEWAQRVRVVCMWAGVRMDTQTGSNAAGWVWGRIGPQADTSGISTQITRWDLAARAGGVYREVMMAADERNVPAGLRGRNVACYLRGRVVNTGDRDSYPVLDNASSVTMDIEFFETAV